MDDKSLYEELAAEYEGRDATRRGVKRMVIGVVIILVIVIIVAIAI
jgi:hypothetical protein